MSSAQTLVPAPLDPTAPPRRSRRMDGSSLFQHRQRYRARIVDTGGYDDNVYVLDVTSGTTTLISSNAAGTGTGDGNSIDPSIAPMASSWRS